MKNLNHVLIGLAVGVLFYSTAEGAVIGISDNCRRPQFADTKYFTDMLERAGHNPIVLQWTSDTNRIEEIVSRIDCLLLSGGEDIDPGLYGAKKDPRCGRVNERRDAYDWALCRAAVRRRLPIVGICRGEQVLNVFFGGDLCQHIDGHGFGRWDGDGTNRPAHIVRIASDSRLARVIGTEDLAVNSHHHQAVRRVAPGFRVVAVAADGTIEVIEGDSYPAVGIQFHPESILANDAHDPGFDKVRLLKLLQGIMTLASADESGR